MFHIDAIAIHTLNQISTDSAFSRLLGLEKERTFVTELARSRPASRPEIEAFSVPEAQHQLKPPEKNKSQSMVELRRVGVDG